MYIYIIYIYIFLQICNSYLYLYIYIQISLYICNFELLTSSFVPDLDAAIHSPGPTRPDQSQLSPVTYSLPGTSGDTVPAASMG